MKKQTLFAILFCLFVYIGHSQEPLKIACVGNSITYGSGVVNREMNAYPQQLQHLLGDKFLVKNYGVSGRTLLKKGDYPYWETNEYMEALEFNPDIVFIKLGTNDSKLQNRIHLEEFESNYKELINSFKRQNENARIILLLPVPAFTKDTTSIWDKPIKNKIIPITQKVAYKTNVEVLDLYHLFLDRSNLLPDGVHPSGLGATVIAKRLYEAIVQKESQAIDFSIKNEFSEVSNGNFYGYNLTNFKFNQVDCKVVVPKKPAIGKPWVLRARFWGHEPQTDIALLERGFHIAYCDVANLYGNKQAVKRWNKFYKLMTNAGLSKKVVLEGMSRGGLIVYNWAVKNSEKVAGIYADAPVLDGKSWPKKRSNVDWEKFKKAYGLKNHSDVDTFKGNPIHKINQIAKAGFPMLHVVGEADKVVPISENTVPFENGIKTSGGNIKVIYKPNNGHHPHSLKNPTPIVDFILRATGQKVNFAVVPSPSAEFRSAAGWVKGKGWWAQANDIDSLCQNSGKVDLLLMGNSITQGWGGNRPNVTHYPGKKAVETYFEDLKIVGAGISGDRTQHILWRLQNGNYEKANPTIVVLAIGVNNFGDNTASEIVVGIKNVMHLAREKFKSKTKILLLGPLPTGIDPKSDRRKKYNDIHKALSNLKMPNNVSYHNLISLFTDDKGFLKEEYYSGDGIHLKPEGYNVWGKYLREIIK
ncbi:GDSL-type esterase/lipase family protein [Aureibaculum conchae]|uniref:GDSL-type esterase/lipase family protein n=1 Tax=Aureibaculum sp. 2308TA14-22 TaxID=3108392 RepID=UPI0033955DAD